MARSKRPESLPVEDASEMSSEQNSRLEWRVYLEAAVRRQQQLKSLNERLARFLSFAHDVDFGANKQRCNRSPKAPVGDSVPQKGKSSEDPAIEARSTDSWCQNSFEIEELETAIQEKTRSFRSSLELYDIRIDALRCAMNSLNEKNEELMQENAELRLSNNDASFELRQLRDDNERLKERIQRLGSISRQVPPKVDTRSQENVINSLQQENRKLKARLSRQKQTLRSGVDDFIARSIEALQNGTSLDVAYEKTIGYDSGDEMELALCKVSGSREALASDEQVVQLEDQLRSISDELQHEKFRSERKFKLVQEASSRLKANLARKENDLQQTNKELESALGALQSLIQTSDEMQIELDFFRRLLDREECRLNDKFDDDSCGASFASETSFLSQSENDELDSGISAKAESSPAKVSTKSGAHSLEIANHDVRKGKFVVLENKGDEPLDISRWYLVQQCGDNKVTHRFPSPFVIKARSKVIIWSADSKASHQSPSNYVMPKTVLPWCDSGEVDLVTKIYDRLGNQISKLETRIVLRGPLAKAKLDAIQDSRSLLDALESTPCSIT